MASKKFYINKLVNTTHELCYAIGSSNINYWNDPRYAKNTEFVKCENPIFFEMLFVKDKRHPTNPDITYYKAGNVYDKPNPHITDKLYDLKFNGKNF